jgi:DHA3 family macrolide efflux protein-like MFS transporter
MVPEAHLSRIAGINQAMRGTVNIVGPLLAAFLMSVVPFWGVLSVDVITAILAVLSLLFVLIPSPQQTEGENQTIRSVAMDVYAGMKYVRQWSGLTLLMAGTTLLNFLFMPAFALMPLLVTKHFLGGALQLSWIEAMFGVGIVVGGLLLGVWGGFKRRIVTSLVGLLGMALGMALVFGAPGNMIWLAMAGMLLVGINMPITNGPFFAIIQARVEPAMQGRVFSLIASISGAAVPVSMIIAGPTAELVGVRMWFLVAAIGCMLMGASGFFVPAIMNLENEPHSAGQESSQVPVLEV